MFLKYLSGYEYEERYWRFLFRFETVVSGVVKEASKRDDLADADKSSAFFRAVFAKLLDVDSGLIPPNWWENVDVPPILWFERYLVREIPTMTREARRIKEQGADASEDDPFDREKIRRLAHRSLTFRKFLFEASGVPVKF